MKIVSYLRGEDGLDSTHQGATGSCDSWMVRLKKRIILERMMMRRKKKFFCPAAEKEGLCGIICM